MLTVAGLSKLNNQTRFTASLRTLGIKSPGLVKLGSFLTPVYEIILGVLLIIGWFSIPISLLNVLTFALFLGVKIRLATKDPDADCGCFGQQKASIDVASLTTSGILVLLSLLNLLLATNDPFSPLIRLIAFVSYLAYVVFWLISLSNQRRLASIVRRSA